MVTTPEARSIVQLARTLNHCKYFQFRPFRSSSAGKMHNAGKWQTMAVLQLQLHLFSVHFGVTHLGSVWHSGLVRLVWISQEFLHYVLNCFSFSIVSSLGLYRPSGFGICVRVQFSVEGVWLDGAGRVVGVVWIYVLRSQRLNRYE